MITAQQAREQIKPLVKTDQEIEDSISLMIRNGYNYSYMELTEEQVNMLSGLGYTVEFNRINGVMNQYRVTW